ncbi:RluA family pseudouridine synthase [Salinispira pacifica]
MQESTRSVEERFDGLRVDRFVSATGESPTRSQLHQRNPVYTVNGRTVKPSHRVRAGDVVSVQFDEAPPPAVSAEPVELDILYEDDSVLVINKPAGMVVHPAHGSRHGTLMQGLLYRIETLGAQFAGSVYRDRPGIVHRLDKDTSGVIVAAKNPASLEHLSAQFRTRSVVKRYFAVVKGIPEPRSGKIEGRIRRDPVHRKRFALSTTSGKPSRTRYRVIRDLDGYALVELRPTTGRTHQLRVHMRHIGHPILGDPIYGRTDSKHPGATLMLHAAELTIETPDGVRRTFRAPLPERFRSFLAAARR